VCIARSFTRFSARREHANREFEVAVDHIARGPVARIPVIEIPRAGREAEHGKDAPVREPFAQPILDEHLILARERDPLNELVANEIQRFRARRRICRQYGPNQKQVAGVFHFCRVPIDPFLNDLRHSVSRVAGGRSVGWLGPCVRSSELSVDTVAV